MTRRPGAARCSKDRPIGRVPGCTSVRFEAGSRALSRSAWALLGWDWVCVSFSGLSGGDNRGRLEHHVSKVNPPSNLCVLYGAVSLPWAAPFKAERYEPAASVHRVTAVTPNFFLRFCRAGARSVSHGSGKGMVKRFTSNLFSGAARSVMSGKVRDAAGGGLDKALYCLMRAVRVAAEVKL